MTSQIPSAASCRAAPCSNSACVQPDGSRCSTFNPTLESQIDGEQWQEHPGWGEPTNENASQLPLT